jgi:hypothetical protein
VPGTRRRRGIYARVKGIMHAPVQNERRDGSAVAV